MILIEEMSQCRSYGRSVLIMRMRDYKTHDPLSSLSPSLLSLPLSSLKREKRVVETISLVSLSLPPFYQVHLLLEKVSGCFFPVSFLVFEVEGRLT